jgi:hypothetical protein
VNIALLEAVKEQILREPDRVLMHDWLSGTGHSHDLLTDCQTAGCIAGWTCALGQAHSAISVRSDAIRLLDIDSQQAGRLFVVGGWPTSLATGYSSTGNRKERAAIIAARIDLFISSGGAI